MHVKSVGNTQLDSVFSLHVSSSLTVSMAYTGAQKALKSDKLDEAQALAKSCAGRPDFLPCDGLSICATHSHGKCFKLHWCCHLGWCHCKWPTSDMQMHSIPLYSILNTSPDNTISVYSEMRSSTKYHSRHTKNNNKGTIMQLTV